MRAALAWLALCQLVAAQVLTPSQITISYNKPITASATCGEVNGQPITEVYCSLAGSSQYTPLNAYSYSEEYANPAAMQELRNPRELFIHGGHGCGHCEALSPNAHPASHMVDGNTSWWQSPPLSRGMQYNQVNITIDLLQEFHVAYVWIQMANSPKPGVWVLEKSVDYGKTFEPWYYFADNDAECSRRFGVESLAPISSDDQIICRSDFSSIQPLENGEIMINLMESRPSRDNFMSSSSLQNFTRATTVRLRLLGTRTLQGHLMDLNEKTDPTVTRRYYYAIKEVLMGGRCVCNGHAKTCDIINPSRPKTLLCRCEHNTCGDMCEQCCPGFVQKKWQPTTARNNFSCEPCNCFGRSNECVYEEELDLKGLSLDIHGEFAGGGRCLNCRFNTEGINCDSCQRGFYRPKNREWNETSPCEECRCDPSKHTGACAEGTGKCECLPQFTGEECEQCSPGYHSPPQCLPCDCSLQGTEGGICQPTNGTCPCKNGFGGDFCDRCADGFTSVDGECKECECDSRGAVNSNCSGTTGQCVCKAQYSGKGCQECALGYFNQEGLCNYCECDPAGTEGGVCDQKSGQCLCSHGFIGKHCDSCDVGFFGYPNCRACECDLAGSDGISCDSKSGECDCRSNYTGRGCDKCAAGFYSFPECKECSCFAEGSKGLTCDQNGQCFCKHNFEGERCDRCLADLYNFPLCEKCECDPAGVSNDFAGCDKVAPGELCTCKKNVQGRICNECKATFWDLQYYHREGCVECACLEEGTLSRLNTCSLRVGQCHCKKNVGGRNCDRCAPGFYRLHGYNAHGCQPCNCDVGGALKGDCDGETGQCKCRPRVGGIRCHEPIHNHFFPTLWHHKYEAEDGRNPENRPVRFAIDSSLFPHFSSRGYAVFSPIQDEIVLDIDIPKSAIYRVLLRVLNPSPVPMIATVTLSPLYTNTHDEEQKAKLTLPSSNTSYISEVSAGKPFLLNVGKWSLSLKTKQRLFVDFAVLLPADYYEGTALLDYHSPACQVFQSAKTCADLRLPSWPSLSTATLTPPAFFYQEHPDEQLDLMAADILPPSVGHATHLTAANDSRVVLAYAEIPSDGDYVVVLEYFNVHKTDVGVETRVKQGQVSVSLGKAVIHHCPYTSFCRDAVTSNGEMGTVSLKEGAAVVELILDSSQDFGLASLKLLKKEDWSEKLLQPVLVCMKKDGECQPLLFPPAASSLTTEAEAGRKEGDPIPLSGDKLPFPVANADDLKVMPVGKSTALDISGVVTLPNHYMLVLHYFNPNSAVNLQALLTSSEHFYDTSIPLPFCPSVGGCRALVREKDRPEIIQFYVEDKYSLSIMSNDSLPEEIFVDHLTAVPYMSFSPSLMSPLPLDLSADFVERCSADHFQNDPSTNISDFCKANIFSLTTNFNGAALPCECNSHGSTSFTCSSYGGQCECKENVIGRRCDRCAAGHYGFPECKKCSCGRNQQCDDRSGQCFCPQHVEGRECEKCVSYAFGYDPLIGCQKCGCHPQGSHEGQLLCDAESGQCLCKQSVGGRQCSSCLAGHYGFPYCHLCRCNREGTAPSVCDATTAACTCKANVVGGECDRCKEGTFALSAVHHRGCIECFCFGVTDHCQSSALPVVALSIDMSAVEISHSNGTITVDENNHAVYSAGNYAARVVYFDIPLQESKDYTSSYGLVLQYKLSCEVDKENLKSTSEADVVLTGHNVTAEFWAEEQPADPSLPFGGRLRLDSEQLLHPSGRGLSREETMLLLHGLSSIRIKASFWEGAVSARLIDFSIESIDESAQDEVLRASTVERCACPPPYIGLSCQECAPGFYRVSGGGPLGSCVPCECNSHSGTCDPVTGVCSECQHNTEGDHCERCVEGHYGDANTGSPYACVACQCPYAPENNFATSCNVTSEGYLLSCDCKPGYTGDRCELCDSGFFGDPTSSGGTCEPCSCSGNNDLSDPSSCHPLSGHCFLCQNNTYGAACELCAPWHFGDAVTAKDCGACDCAECGSHHCNPSSGECECKQNVVGSACDTCAPGHFGFSSCGGCSACDCGVASLSSECHEESGQCPCQPGAAGLRCHHCEYGYWNYGEHGCSKCDCEASLSRGTVCDVLSGQCHCQEGATGSRCDECLPSYLRIPDLGCRRCDECVHSLVAEVDGVESRLSLLSSSISSISAATIDGARLSRSSKKLAVINETLFAISDLDSVEDNSRQTVIRKVLEDSAVTRMQAETTARRSYNNSLKAENIAKDGQEVMEDVKTRALLALAVVDSLRGLQHSMEEKAGQVQARPEWITEGRETLSSIYQANADLKQFDAHESTTAKVTDLVAQVKRKQDRLKEEVKEKRAKEREIKKFLTQSEEQLRTAENAGKSAQLKTKDLDVFKVESLKKSVEEEVDKSSEATVKVGSVMKSAGEAIERASSQAKNLKEVLQKFNETLAVVNEKNTARKKRDLAEGEELKERLNSAVTALADTATGMKKTFGSTKEASKNALEAAQTYDGVSESIQAASKSATASAHYILHEKDNLLLLKEEVSAAAHASQTQLDAVAVLKKEEMKELKEELLSMETKAMLLKAQLHSMTERLENVGKVASLNETVKEALEKFVIGENGDNVEAEKEKEKQKEEVQEMVTNAEKKIRESLESQSGMKQAKANLNEMKEKRTRLPQKWQEMAEELKNGSARLERMNEQLRSLKESLAMARDAAEKLTLPAHFEVGSSLDVHLQQPLGHSAVATDLSFALRTQHDGTPIYLGNVGGVGDEYLAVQVEGSKPTLIVQMGDEPHKIQLKTSITDGEWHQLSVSRVGRSVSFSLLTPDGKVTRETRSLTSSGDHSILNLNKNNAKLLVGGIPEQLQIGVEQRHFVGDITEVVLNGESVGLWSSNEAGVVKVGGAGKPPSSKSPLEKEVGLSGDGFLTFKMGFWNPRRRSSFTLAFLTYAPDGLLFYVGKDRDFMSLEVAAGLVKLSIDFGSGVASYSSEQTYHDGQWHTVTVVREEKDIRLQVDQEDHSGQVPGEMSELSVGDYFYLGGVPLDVHTRSTVEPLKGCLRSVKLGSEVLSLHSAFRSKGISEGCPSSQTREISLLSERSSASFENISLSNGEPSLSFELAFRFKTHQADAVIATVTNDEEDRLISISLSKGGVIISGVDSEFSSSLGIVAVNDGFWHYVSIRIESAVVKASLDDAFFADLDKIHLHFEPFEKYSLRFGKQKEGHFVGCIRDVSFAGELLQFSKAVHREVRLTGCALKEDAEAVSNSSESGNSSAHRVLTTLAPTLPSITTTEEPPPESPAIRRATFPQVCALDAIPGNKSSADSGERFGQTPFSRIEYSQEPESIAKAGTLSLWVRVEAASGPLVYMANRQLTDHFGLFILDGFVIFTFNTGSGQMKLRSHYSLLDRHWHLIKASRKGNFGQLTIDDDVVEGTGVQTTDSVDYEFPIYIGGVDNATSQAFKAIGMTDMKPTLSGCIKNVAFNGRPLVNASYHEGTLPCSNTKEDGLFLGAGGGYSIISYDDPIVTLKVEIRFRSRVTDGLLFSIGKVDYVSLSFEGGAIVFRMKTADKVTSEIVHKATRNVSFCDGHWHHVKIFRKKNLLTMAVDGKSKMKIGKKAGSDFSLSDPMVVGKAPKGMVNDELMKHATFVGCVQVANESGEEEKRKRREEPATYNFFQETQTFGDAYAGCHTI